MMHTDVTGVDGESDQLILGTGPNYDTNSAENPADITGVTETLFLTNTESSAPLELFANDSSQVSQAYLEIRVPTTELTTENGTEQLSNRGRTT